MKTTEVKVNRHVIVEQMKCSTNIYFRIVLLMTHKMGLSIRALMSFIAVAIVDDFIYVVIQFL